MVPSAPQIRSDALTRRCLKEALALNTAPMTAAEEERRPRILVIDTPACSASTSSSARTCVGCAIERGGASAARRWWLWLWWRDVEWSHSQSRCESLLSCVLSY